MTESHDVGAAAAVVATVVVLIDRVLLAREGC
jgi:hypothetical protein